MSDTLLLIDCQRDFHPGGSLAIPTAHEDAARIAAMIQRHGAAISRIVATLDTHQKLHIYHPGFWWNAAGNQHPAPFTIISHQDLVDGKWKPRTDLAPPTKVSEMLDASIFDNAASVMQADGVTLDIDKYVIEYARRLEANGRFQICVWPEHCLIGSAGHAIVDDIRVALHQWSEMTGRSVEWVMKGQNLLTEMYSALAADVPVSVGTAFNEELQQSLVQTPGRLLVCGQAMSHCVNYTLRDIASHWPSEQRHRIVLLTDGASAVPGFEAAGDAFQHDMQALGVQLRTIAQAFQ